MEEGVHWRWNDRFQRRHTGWYLPEGEERKELHDRVYVSEATWDLLEYQNKGMGVHRFHLKLTAGTHDLDLTLSFQSKEGESWHTLASVDLVPFDTKRNGFDIDKWTSAITSTTRETMPDGTIISKKVFRTFTFVPSGEMVVYDASNGVEDKKLMNQVKKQWSKWTSERQFRGFLRGQSDWLHDARDADELKLDDRQ